MGSLFWEVGRLRYDLLSGMTKNIVVIFIWRYLKHFNY